MDSNTSEMLPSLENAEPIELARELVRVLDLK